MLLLLFTACAPTAEPPRPGHLASDGVEEVGAPYEAFPGPSCASVSAGPNGDRGDDTDGDDPSQADFLFEDGTIHALALTLDPSAISELDNHPDVDVHTTVTYNDRSWDAAVHIKGTMTLRTFAGKPSLKLDFHQWDPTKTFFGLRRLTLNSMLQDQSMLKEHLSYRLHAALGVPAPRHGYLRLTVNGEPYGLYGVIENMDEQFLNRAFPGDDAGNLYEGGYGADVHAGQAGVFTVQQSGRPAPPTDMQNLIDAFEASTPASYLQLIAVRFDLDALMTAFAVDLVGGNSDAYARRANNFLLYHAPEANRWTLIPWGQDQAFLDNDTPMWDNWQGKLLDACGQAPDCLELLNTYLVKVLDGWEAMDLTGYAQREALVIQQDCETDPRDEIPCDPKKLLTFLAERPAHVRAELAAHGL